MPNARRSGVVRPRVEPSFIADVIGRMIPVSDPDSIGAMRSLSNALGRRVGGSTGTNMMACATLIDEMAAAGMTGSIVTMLCDAGERYAGTYYDDAWLAGHGLDHRSAEKRVDAILAKDVAMPS